MSQLHLLYAYLGSLTEDEKAKVVECLTSKKNEEDEAKPKTEPSQQKKTELQQKLKKTKGKDANKAHDNKKKKKRKRTKKETIMKFVYPIKDKNNEVNVARVNVTFVKEPKILANRVKLWIQKKQPNTVTYKSKYETSMRRNLTLKKAAECYS